MTFLIVYDRSSSSLKLETYDDQRRADALARRAEIELEMRDRPEIEVVVLAADSIETLKRTHSRYFETLEAKISAHAR